MAIKAFDVYKGIDSIAKSLPVWILNWMFV